MQQTKCTSLGEQISKKMSGWILILVLLIVVGIFSLSYLLSRQIFNQQVNIWKIVIPQYVMSNLIDSDYVSIRQEINVIESTGIFSSFMIADKQKKVIAEFGKASLDLKPIRDEDMDVWGYYSFEPNYHKFSSPFLCAGSVFLTLVLLFYFIIRWRMRSSLEREFLQFNQFLKEIELITEKLNEIYNDDQVDLFVRESSSSAEQEMINRAVSRLIEDIRRANKSLREAVSESEKKRFHEELTRTALQVVHDIGSPLAALEATIQSPAFTVSEKYRVSIRNAVSRIRDIANTLLKKSRHCILEESDSPLMQHLLFNLISCVVAEKRLQYKNKVNIEICYECTQGAYSLFAIVRGAEFNRILSNIINNAVEAIDVDGRVIVLLGSDDKYVIVEVQDNGRGIPESILSKLGKFGVSFGKEKGLGLGLCHAKNTLEMWGGKLEFESKMDKGTKCRIYIPRSQHPDWFLPEIQLSNNQNIIIIDDDESIHSIWNERFSRFMQESGYILSLYHFSSPEKFSQWRETQTKDANEFFYLCDYEFIGSHETGLELIERYKINYLSVIVTSRAHESDIIDRCESSGIKVLPKDLAILTPLRARSKFVDL